MKDEKQKKEIYKLVNFNTLFSYKLFLIRQYGLFRNKCIRIDASTICQLRCPECSRTKQDYGIIAKGFLKFDDFKNMIEKNPGIRKVELSSYGEIFLNPELGEIIRYAFEKNVDLSAANGVNLNNISEGILESLVKYKFRSLSISLDGATNETYSIYRKNGNFDKVIDNIRTIVSFKKKYGSIYPILKWQYILFGHNVAEVEKAKLMAKELGMSFNVKLNWNPEYSPVSTEQIESLGIKYLSRNDYETKKKKIYRSPCYQFFAEPQINFDGTMLGCCINKWISFGNVFDSNIRNIIRSKKYKETEDVISGKKEAAVDIPCYYCHLYHKSRGITPAE
jgi:MoaA/NifB/PqqE/SkfB family radical SAM enzyme